MQKKKAKKRIGIIKGGPSHEHKISLKTAEHIKKHLPEHCEPIDIFVDLKGNWFINDKFVYPEKAARLVDVILNATHGAYGEDGKLQHILDHVGVPYTGSGVIPSILGMNKMLTKKAFSDFGLLTPRGVVVEGGGNISAKAAEAYRKIGSNLIVKPLASGSSYGVVHVNNLHDLIKAIELVSKISPQILVEEFVGGKEVTVGVIDNFRGQKFYSLPVAEIRPQDGGLYTTLNKMGEGINEVVPSVLPLAIKKLIEETAVKSHEAIGGRHYSRTDMIITPKGKIYVLEINTQPGLAENDIFVKSLNSVGISYGDFLDHIISLALKN